VQQACEKRQDRRVTHCVKIRPAKHGSNARAQAQCARGQITSATLTPVIGMVKVVGIVVLSALFLGERDIFSARMVVGCTLAVLGFTMYSYACLEAQQRRRTVWVKAGSAEGVGVGSGGAKAAADPEGAPLLPTSTPASAGGWGAGGRA